MTVKELREILASHPDDLRVMVRGYEAGLEDLLPSEVKVVHVRLNVNDSPSIYGPHEEQEDPRNADVMALLLDRAESEYREDPQ